FIYQFTIYFAMSLGMLSTDLKLITAIVIIAFLATGNLNISLKKNVKLVPKINQKKEVL
ncbi:TPA: ABC transporter permease, partial [Clostridioides difficile]|nr:ABC transporter permease [Clostridioides difficile]